MHIKPLQIPPIPTKPQLHSSKHHHTYNGTRCLPITTWVRSPTVRATQLGGDFTFAYEIILYYEHNRACTVYRTWDDFRTLRKALRPWRDATSFNSELDVQGMHLFLREALAKRADDCAVEYFLRRRMEDCGGW